MTEAHSTLVAADFSPSSLAALDFALLLEAKERAPSVHLVHVVPTPTLPTTAGDVLLVADFDRRLRGEAERALDTFAHARTSIVPIESRVLTGAAAEMLVAEAVRLGARRVVVGGSRPGPLARLLLGSVADRVVRTSSIDVMVVPAPNEGERARTRVRNVVCATDFSAPAELALLRALEITRAHDARLHLVHAWEVASYVDRVPDLRTSIERELSRELDAAAHRHEAPGVPILRHLRRGHPPSAILAAATQVEADLIVVGTTGKRGVDRLLLGSVAERVTRTSEVPVLVAR